MTTALALLGAGLAGDVIRARLKMPMSKSSRAKQLDF